MQIIGTRAGSSFRVHDRYFIDKRRFHPGQDPTTGGPLAVVEDWSDTKVLGKTLELDPSSQWYGQVVDNS